MPKAKPHPLSLLLLSLLVLLPFGGWAGDFEAANQAYDQGKFAEAKGGYEKLLESGSGGANIYYDLGNADFRLGSAGRAILNYERGAGLEPRSSRGAGKPETPARPKRSQAAAPLLERQGWRPPFLRTCGRSSLPLPAGSWSLASC
ncbi:MAG: hypothetical protein WDN28_11820 [Chthoniobacter sp.]